MQTISGLIFNNVKYTTYLNVVGFVSDLSINTLHIFNFLNIQMIKVCYNRVKGKLNRYVFLLFSLV